MLLIILVNNFLLLFDNKLLLIKMLHGCYLFIRFG